MRKSNKDFLYKTIFRLFLSESYECVSIKDIENATGMTRGAVFYYAKNKEELFCKVVEKYFFEAQNIEDKLHAVRCSASSLLDFIHVYVQAIEARVDLLQGLLEVERSKASRAYLSFILQAQKYYPDFNKKMNNVFEHEINLWQTVIRTAQINKEIKDYLDCNAVAMFFRSSYLGICYLSALKEGIDPARLEYQFMTIYSIIKN